MGGYTDGLTSPTQSSFDDYIIPCRELKERSTSLLDISDQAPLYEPANILMIIGGSITRQRGAAIHHLLEQCCEGGSLTNRLIFPPILGLSDFWLGCLVSVRGMIKESPILFGPTTLFGVLRSKTWLHPRIDA